MTRIDTTTSKKTLGDYLYALGHLDVGEKIIDVSIAGAGNMNVVLRVKTTLRSLIVKQTRPFVQKYPNIPAPIDRIAIEQQFYHALTSKGKTDPFPKILGYSKEEYLLVMEDLGALPDVTSCYADRFLNDALLKTLVTTLYDIHSTAPPKDFPLNTELKALNHQHIFVLPFLEDNGFSLDTIQKGLQALSMPFKTNSRLKEVVTTLGKKYLENGTTLLHGDYYPGSWMQNEDAFYVIDPEFSFVGEKAFDLGVLAAHMILATSKSDYLDKVVQLYSGEVSKDLVRQYTGVEIIRRLIGLAQLPLERSLKEKKELLQVAENFLLGN